MNKVILVGNLTADPELRKTTGDISVCSFRLAVQRKYTNLQGVREADFFSVTVWRQVADLCAKYLAKGRKVGVVGSLQVKQYEGKDGVKRTVTDIVADEVEFLSPFQADNAAQREPASENKFVEVKDDELPF